MTLATAKARLRESRMTIRKRDGEYRVNFKDGKEDDAYYTTDIADAVSTGIAMRKMFPETNDAVKACGSTIMEHKNFWCC